MKSSFKGKVGKADEKFKSGANYGYLNLPDGVSVFSPELDETVLLDFMPYAVTDTNHPEKDTENGIALAGDLWYRRPFKIHRNIGSGSDAVVCLQSFGKKCPICEYITKLKKDATGNAEQIKALKISERVLYCVIPLNAKKDGKSLEKKPHIFDISYAMFGKMLKKEMDNENIPEVFMDLVEGETLKIRFDEKSMGTGKPFAEAGRIDSKKRDTPYKENILSKIPNLDEVLRRLSYTEMENKFMDLDSEEKADDIKEEKETSKKDKMAKPEKEDEMPVLEWEELSKMTEKQMIKYCANNDLDADPDDFENNEDGLRKAIAAELGIDIPKKKNSKKDEESKIEKEEDTDLTWEDISKMKDAELRKLCKKEKLDANPEDFDDDIKSFRTTVAKELGLKIPKTIPTPDPIAKEDRCVACGGSGKSSKGGICTACGGTGVKQKQKPSESKNTCPDSKGNFGVDTDELKMCDTCKLWDACDTEKDRLKKEKKGKK